MLAYYRQAPRSPCKTCIFQCEHELVGVVCDTFSSMSSSPRTFFDFFSYKHPTNQRIKKKWTYFVFIKGAAALDPIEASGGKLLNINPRVHSYGHQLRIDCWKLDYDCRFEIEADKTTWSYWEAKILVWFEAEGPALWNAGSNWQLHSVDWVFYMTVVDQTALC